jgi:hypothetical protein
MPKNAVFCYNYAWGEYVIIMLKVKNAVPKRVPELPQSTIDDVYIESGWQKLL